MAAPPLEAFTRTAVLYGGGLTLWLIASAVRRRTLVPYQQAAALLFWVATAVVATAHLLGVLRATDQHDVAVSVAYAIAAVVVMPALWRRGEEGGRPTSSTAETRLAALATAVTVVLLLRLGAVW